ncbi:MAG: DVUA0089 family protein [Sedimentisphaerales bacterium]|nr:DVUA0089 family protein [Sedimentisphaerales bacterium]
MEKFKIMSLSVALVLALLAGVSQAGFDFDGYIDYHNEVDYYYFNLASDATLVEVWTDSFNDGANFDPITALWNATTGDLIAENDDNPNIRPATQTYWDSGFSLSSLVRAITFSPLRLIPTLQLARTSPTDLAMMDRHPFPLNSTGWVLPATTM